MSGGIPEDALGTGLSALARIWSCDPDVAAAFLYGSRARGRARAGSDVDLAVILRACLSPAARWRKRLALIDSAGSALGTDAIDLVVLEEAPAPLGHRIVRAARLLLDADPPRRVAVVEDVLRRYLHEAPLRRALDEGLGERLEGGRFAR